MKDILRCPTDITGQFEKWEAAEMDLNKWYVELNCLCAVSLGLMSSEHKNNFLDIFLT